MSERNWTLFLKDIHTSADRAIRYTKGMTLAQFKKDRKTVDAVLRNLEVIGEAVKKLPANFRRDHSEVEWKKIAGLRDIVIHEYFGIDEELIWDVIQNNLPELRRKVRAFLKEIS